MTREVCGFKHNWFMNENSFDYIRAWYELAAPNMMLLLQDEEVAKVINNNSEQEVLGIIGNIPTETLCKLSRYVVAFCMWHSKPLRFEGEVPEFHRHAMELNNNTAMNLAELCDNELVRRHGLPQPNSGCRLEVCHGMVRLVWDQWTWQELGYATYENIKGIRAVVCRELGLCDSTQVPEEEVPDEGTFGQIADELSSIERMSVEEHAFVFATDVYRY